MSMSAALSNFRGWRERQEARQGAERLETDDAHPLQPEAAPEEEVTLAVSTPTSSRSRATEERSETPLVETVSEEDDDDEDDEEDDDIESPRSDDAAEDASETRVITIRESRSRRTISLADLEEEREIARRRTMGCAMIAAFILFRLWVQAVATDDFGLLMLCLVGTHWTARFIRHTREREEELDRLIHEYTENGGEENENNATLRDLSRMSFQSQLAEAILRSQMEMMQGGFGPPDGAENSTPGVSDAARGRWNRFKFNAEQGLGDLADENNDVEKGKGFFDEEEPHCSICLGEYEDGEQLVCLPCKHVYHEDCVGSWCNNHIRCPLCNFDLESISSDGGSSLEVV